MFIYVYKIDIYIVYWIRKLFMMDKKILTKKQIMFDLPLVSRCVCNTIA